MTVRPEIKSWASRVLRQLPTLFGVLLLGGAVFVVQREFRHLNVHEVGLALAKIPHHALVIAALWTFVAYGILTFYDKLGTIYAGTKVSYWRNAFASFCAYSLAHNLGFAAVSGAAVRYRLYAHWGLSAGEIAKVVAFCSLTFGLGGMTLGGFILFLEPRAVPYFGTTLPLWALHAAGLLLWAIVLAYVLVSLFLPVFKIRGQLIELPKARMALVQVALATLDVGATASIFYALLPDAPGLTFFRFLAVYLGSYAAGLIANVPGGLGVFDAAMLVGLDPYLPAPIVLSAMFVFRLYYYVIPLFIAGSLFAGNEVAMRSRSLVRVAPAATRWSEPDFAVAAATGVVALSGVVLLSIGVLDSHPDYSWMDADFSAAAASAGQYIPSLIGTTLMVMAVGLSLRVKLAWGSAIALLIAGSIVTALQGEPLFVPGFLIAAALMLAPFRAAYYRHARLFSQPLQATTLVPLFALLSSIFWLASFEPKVRYLAQTSWWQVVISHATPTPVRYAVALATVFALTALWGVLRPAKICALPWNGTARLKYAAMGAAPPAMADGLVLGEAGRAAIPFRRVGNVILGLGDPAGSPADRVSAIWRLRDLARAERRAPAFYRAGTEYLKIYGDLGLTALPLGADGVPLARDKLGPLPGRMYLCCVAERDLQSLLPLFGNAPPIDSTVAAEG